MTGKKSLIILLLGFVAIFLQGAVFKFLMPGMIAPNFHVVLAVFVAFYDPSSRGAALAFLLGLQSDLASGILLGPMAGALVVIFALVTLVSQRIFTEAVIAASAAVFLATFLARTIFILLMNQFSFVAPIATWALFWEAILNAGLTPFVFMWLKKFRGRDSDGYRFSSRGSRGMVR